MKKSLLISGLALCVALCGDAQVPKDLTEKPKDGFVPNEATAIAIAEAVWIPLYGKRALRKERPFHANLTNGVWHARGSLPKGYHGGVAHAEIVKENGCILRVWHEK